MACFVFLLREIVLRKNHFAAGGDIGILFVVLDCLCFHVNFFWWSLVVAEKCWTYPAFHGWVFKAVGVARAIGANPSQFFLIGKGFAENNIRKPDFALGTSLTSTLIISGTPATNGSRLRPTAGSSKTRCPCTDRGQSPGSSWSWPRRLEDLLANSNTTMRPQATK